MKKGQFADLLRTPLGAIIVAAFLFLGVYMLMQQTGVINDLLKALGKSDKDTFIEDFSIAKASMDALVCAINAVEKGDGKLCEGIDFQALRTQQNPPNPLTSFFAAITGMASERTERKEFTNPMGSSKEAEGECNEFCATKGCTCSDCKLKSSSAYLYNFECTLTYDIRSAEQRGTTVECEAPQRTAPYVENILTSEGWKGENVILGADDAYRKSYCEKPCNYPEVLKEVSECSPKLIDTGKSEEWYMMMPNPMVLQCDCVCEGKKSTITSGQKTYGITKKQAFSTCDDICEDENSKYSDDFEPLTVKNCAERAILSRDFSGDYLDKYAENVQRRDTHAVGKVRKCTCEHNYNDGTSDIYPVYGRTDQEAEEICTNDYEFLKSHLKDKRITNCQDLETKKGPDAVVINLYDISEKDLTEKKEKIHICEYDYKLKKELECRVINFQMPERFGGWTGGGTIKQTAQDYISTFKDPTFLVYFQEFPVGEDYAWAGKVSLFHTVTTAIFTTMCGLRFFVPVAKGIKWVQQTGLHPIKAYRNYKEMKNLETTFKAGIKDSMTRSGAMTEAEATKYADDVFNQMLVADGIKNKKGLITMLREHFAKEMNTKIAGTYKNFDEFLLEAKSIEELKSMPNYPGIGPMETAFTSAKAGQKIEYDLSAFLQTEKVVERLRKYNVEGFKEAATPVIKHTMAFLGVDSVITLGIYALNKKVRKTIPNPKEMVLDFPGKDLELTPVEFTGPTKPVILVKPKTIGEVNSPFYVASPCYTDMSVKGGSNYCSQYIYNIDTGYVYCSPYVNKWDVCEEFYQGVAFHLPLKQIWNELGFSGMLGVRDCDKILDWVQECPTSTDIKDTTMFKDNNNDGEWDEIILLPEWHSEIYNKVVFKDKDNDGKIDIFVYDEDDQTKLIEEKSTFTKMEGEIMFDTGYGLQGYVGERVVIKDALNSDGIWDVFILGNPSWAEKYFIDTDGDGKWDKKVLKESGKPEVLMESVGEKDGNIIYSTWCKVDNIEVSVDENSMEYYKNNVYNEEYNFCYATKDDTAQAIITGVAILFDVGAKKLVGGGIGGWVVGTAVDCALMIAHSKIKEGVWPGR